MSTNITPRVVRDRLPPGQAFAALLGLTLVVWSAIALIAKGVAYLVSVL